MNKPLILAQIDDYIPDKARTPKDNALFDLIRRVAEKRVPATHRGNCVLFARKANSAADAQALASAPAGRLAFDWSDPVNVTPTTDPAMLTVVGNDRRLKRVLGRQLDGQGRSGDVFVAISTSGSAPKSCVRHVNCGSPPWCLPGLCGGAAAQLSNFCVRTPNA